MEHLNPKPPQGPAAWFRNWKRDPWIWFAIAAVFVLTYLFLIYPLFSVVRSSFFVDGSLSLSRYFTMLRQARIINTLRNSLLLGATVGVTSTLLGFAYAYVLSRPKVPLRGFFEALTLLPMITPPFSVGLAAVLLLGRSGLITFGLFGVRTGFFYGYWGLLIVQSLAFAPVAYLVLVGMLRSLNPALEEASLNMGGTTWQTFSNVTWPLLRPGLANAFLLSFITSLADFGNPLVIGGDFSVLATSIYFFVIGRYDFGSASALAVILLFPSLGAFFLQRYWIGRKQYITVTGKPTARQGAATCPPVFTVCMSVAVLWSLTILLFYGSILMGGFVRVWGVDFSLTWHHVNVLRNMGLQPLWNTLYLSLISAPLAAIFGLVVAYLTVRKRFLFKRIMEFSTMLSFAVPGTVIGIGYVIAFNSGTIVLTGTATIIVLALVFRNMPIAIRSGVASLQQIDVSLEEAAVNLGANSGQVFWGIVLPLVKASLLAGMIFGFVRAMTAISSVIFLISPRWPLVVPAILNFVESGRMGAASAYSGLMIILIIAIIMIFSRLFGGKGIDVSTSA